MSDSPNPEKPKSRRGFASMKPEDRKRIASLGGKRAHELGKAHRYTTDEARAAGRKGGRRLAEDVVHMSEIGRRGGIKRGEQKRAEKAARLRAKEMPQ